MWYPVLDMKLLVGIYCVVSCIGYEAIDRNILYPVLDMKLLIGIYYVVSCIGYEAIGRNILCSIMYWI